MTQWNKKQRGKGAQGQNRKQSEIYFEKLKNNPKYTETNSGMLYTVINESSGTSPLESDSVTVNQRISLIDGTIISDTYKEIPDTFSLSEAIPGYREGLLLMSEGSRFKFVIPPHLAWGKRGAGKKIGPSATLIIDVRLEKIE